MMSMADFIATSGVHTTSITKVDAFPYMAKSTTPVRYESRMDHWRIVLQAGRTRMTTYYSMGAAYLGAQPKLADVLGCLAADANSIEGPTSFDEWADELGYDTDSRIAERAYKATVRAAKDLLRLLGPSAYSTLLHDTEMD